VEKTTLYLPEDLHRRLRAMSQRMRRPQAELIRDALAEYVARQDRPWPSSIGVARKGGVSAPDAKDWVHARWDAEDERRRSSQSQE